ncbi:MAG: hypothetical protein M1817_002812 [Caeruleum heppii]|nr:MAG: hypothetical protein M1817_002812 [Caeruleum heppii]
MGSSSKNASNRNQTAHQMGIKKEDADRMAEAGSASQGRRGQGGPDSRRILTAREEEVLTRAGKASQNNRGNHVTEDMANHYQRESGDSSKGQKQ